MSWLSEVRADSGVSQKTVATKTGISRSSYSNIETGKRKPSVSVAKKIARALGFDWTRFYD